MFVVGASILFIEIEFRHPSRLWVIALALVMMGLVSLDQVLDYARHVKK